MRYISTRGNGATRPFNEVLLAGLAPDGGLYLPETFPEFSPADWRALSGLPYAEMAARVMHPFIGTALDFETFAALVADAYRDFGHPAVAPLVQVDERRFLLELFHGPTLAFKDVAMQLLGRLFQHALDEADQRITIVGATSGDTGSAAIAAVAGLPRARIVMLHPEGRVSPVQRRQMTTVDAPNVVNLAVRGSFDDCQDLVKAMFADHAFRAAMNLSAVNSINWARVMAQVPYYVAAALALGAPDRDVAFSVPTGNFGNVLAGHVARRMGLPIARLIVGTNRNDILARFLSANDMRIEAVEPSLSPSMDIQVSSNFERLLFELLGRDAACTADTIRTFRATGRMPVPDAAWHHATQDFAGFALDDPGTLRVIHDHHAATGMLLDPHTAIGLAAARACAPDDAAIPVVALATAHPAKFPDAVEQATGLRPALPAHLADLFERPERYTVIDNDVTSVQRAVREAAGLVAA
jgi:threonine synthase